MTIGTKEVTFRWSNYTRPTPKNLLGLAAFLRRFVALVAGTTILMEMSSWVPLSVIGAGWLLDEAKNFFAHVVDDTKQESATAQFDSGEEVTITKDKLE